MKPNWKGYAKEAYHLGYDRAVNDMSGWNLPYENPPEESGTYICLLGEHDGNTLTVRVGFAEFDAEYKRFSVSPLRSESIILCWMPVPPIPANLVEKRILRELVPADRADL